MNDAISEATNHPIRTLVADVVRAMCTKWSRCKVTGQFLMGNDTLEVLIEPDQSDFPVIAGRNGRTIKALEYLVERISWLDHRQRATVTLQESYEGFRDGSQRDETDRLDEHQVVELAKRIAEASLHRRIVFQMERARDGVNLRVPRNRDSHNPDEPTIINALREVIFTVAKANGMTIRIMAQKE